MQRGMETVPQVVLRAGNKSRAFLVSSRPASPLMPFWDCGPITGTRCGPFMSLSPDGHHVAFNDKLDLSVTVVSVPQAPTQSVVSRRVIDLPGKIVLHHQPLARCSTSGTNASSSEEARLTARPQIVGIDWLTAHEVVFAASCYGRLPHAITMHAVGLKAPHVERLLHTLKLPFAASAKNGGMHVALPRDVTSNRSRLAIRLPDPSAQFAAIANDVETLDRVYTMRIDGSELRLVSHLPSTRVIVGDTMPTYQRAPAMSRDGQTVAWWEGAGGLQNMRRYASEAHDRSKNSSEAKRRHSLQGITELRRSWVVCTRDLSTPDAQPVCHGLGDDPFFASDGRLGFVRFNIKAGDVNPYPQFVIGRPDVGAWKQLLVLPPGVHMLGRASLQ